MSCYKNDHVWFGGDSIYLTRALPFAKSKKVLVLCAGTGIQGLIMASRGSFVTAVDINCKAVEYANINYCINDLSDKLTHNEVRHCKVKMKE